MQHNKRNLLLHFLLIFLHHCTSKDTITQNQTFKDGDLLVSSGNSFALGFFTPGSSGSRYIGIWYNKVAEQTVVWVANRDNPINGTSGVLSIEKSGNLVLYDESSKILLWSTNVSGISPTSSSFVQLTDIGNLILFQDQSKITWQSFDYPTNTLLPHMKHGVNRTSGLNRVLTSWKSQQDPGTGDFRFKMELNGSPESFLYKGSERLWRTGPWNGIQLSGIPDMTSKFIFRISYVDNDDEVCLSYSILNPSIFSRLVLNESGTLERLTWQEGERRWFKFWSAPKDQCDNYRHCGSFSDCNPYDLGEFECKCLPGFEPKVKSEWYLRDSINGCIRKQGGRSCGNITDGFIKLTSVKVPDTSNARVNKSLGLKECENMCLKICTCTAYSSANISSGGTGCITWYGELVDIRQFSNGGQDVYIRVTAAELDQEASENPITLRHQVKKQLIVDQRVLQTPVKREVEKGKRTKKVENYIFTNCANFQHVKLIKWCSQSFSALFLKNSKGSDRKKLVIIVVASVAGVLLLLFASWLTLKTRKGKGRHIRQLLTININPMSHYGGSSRSKELDESGDLSVFDLKTIISATDNFSLANKLGEGGFGTVYKGRLQNGREIAVKRLSKSSGQGIEEFKNEVTLIARLQHRNLVRLLGCCIKHEEKMLVYEYLPNKGLDNFIFDKAKGALLNWRKRFEIIVGIARGIVYLHRDSRLKIIHRDLKASNVLLDAAMEPKISDFGMARIFGADQREANTNRVVGTYGYMSPEYAMQGLFSDKSDVFGYGVLLLEIISGRKNSSYFDDNTVNLIGYVWNLWREGNALEIVDPSIGDSYNDDEVLRCIQIGLLCVQEHASDRPTMSEVLSMLSNETSVPSASPKQPAFVLKGVDNNTNVPYSSSASIGALSVDDMTITTVQVR